MTSLPPPPLGPTRALIDELDAWTSAAFAYKEASFARIPCAARRVLDLGCGTGDDVLALAERLGPEARVIGIDTDLELVDEAWRRARNVALNVSFAVSDAHALAFAPDTFDAVRADRLFSHVGDELRVLSEIWRVLRPGGRLILHEELALGREPTTFLDLSERAGFSAIETHPIAPWPRPSAEGFTLVAHRPMSGSRIEGPA
jgi:ubiquinone/menaquinone biosynthesis C-methylase UbiE